ncbi:MAG: serine hydrolase [Deltaproteobacteria bacterium]|nr:serine hydrolase [Deltaproteobacteria bacterium]
MSKIKRWSIRIGGVLVLVVLIAVIVFWKDIQELRGVLRYANTFEPDTIVENFRSLYKQYPNSTVKRSGPVFELCETHRTLPETYMYTGETNKIADWIDRTDTTGLLVIKDGVVAFEKYYDGNEKSTRWISMSVAKSFVSFLIGVALEEGKIKSLQDPVDRYAPNLKGSGYESVSLKNVLQMSSGVRFTEDYGDLKSDIVRLVASFTSGSLNEFVGNLQNEQKPGTFNKYVSADTQVLGMVLAGATKKSLTDYMQEKLWSRLGAEYDAEWLTDPTGTEMAFGGLNATLRDYARFGLLYLNRGINFKGEQLVSARWVKASVTPDAPHLMPGKDNPNSSWPMGYGYQWWIPENPEGDFTAIGIYGQFIYVHPKYNVVIAKTSAYVDYNNTGDEMEFESMEAFRAIARGL